MEIVQKTALITVNATLIFQLVSFLLLVFILNRLMLKPLRRTMQERKEYIENMEEELEAGETKLEDLEVLLDAKKKEFYAHSIGLRKQLMDEANSTSAAIINEARTKVTTELHALSKANQMHAETIRQEFSSLAGDLADGIIDKVLERSAA